MAKETKQELETKRVTYKNISKRTLIIGLEKIKAGATVTETEVNSNTIKRCVEFGFLKLIKE